MGGMSIADYQGPMASPRELMLDFPRRYLPGRVDRTLTYYFSVGDDKYTLTLTPTACTLTPGKPEHADCVVKADPAVFEALVLRDKIPGPIDIARGRFKTNDVALLSRLKDCFRKS